MNVKYLILLTITLVSCGDSDTKINASNTAKPTEIVQVAANSAEISPMERGAKLYKRCKACHTLEDGGRHKVGPNLWDIYGKKAGSKDGFAYSKVMSASEVIWDDKTMDGYIAKPSTFMKGNRMSFVGIKKQEDRDALQLYLKAQTTPN